MKKRQKSISPWKIIAGKLLVQTVESLSKNGLVIWDLRPLSTDVAIFSKVISGGKRLAAGSLVVSRTIRRKTAFYSAKNNHAISGGVVSELYPEGVPPNTEFWMLRQGPLEMQIVDGVKE
jgi:hypothetical protein